MNPRNCVSHSSEADGSMTRILKTLLNVMDAKDSETPNNNA